MEDPEVSDILKDIYQGGPDAVENIPVTELRVDRNVQREGLNMNKVREIVAKFNPQAVGTITVSLRADRSYVIIDGQHRWEAVRILSDNAGFMNAHVYTGLTLGQEAQMFLDLNRTTVPLMADKFKVTLLVDGAEGDAARQIQAIVGAYGWKVSRVPSKGNINCIGVLQRMHRLSLEKNADPHLIQMAILVITRAWGNDRHGAQASVVECLCRIFAEYGTAAIDLDRLIGVLQEFIPRTLTKEAAQLAAIKGSKVSMGMAEMVITRYNKVKKSGSLYEWRASR